LLKGPLMQFNTFDAAFLYYNHLRERERWVVKAVVSNTYPWVNYYHQQIS
jgi:hypothetical protein